MNPIQMRWIARGLALVWACWWTYFAAAGAVSEGGGWQKVMLPSVLAMAVFLGSALLAWRWEVVGGVLLVVEGLLVCAAYPVGFLHARTVDTMVVVLLTLAAPALVSGLLFLGSWWRTHQPGTA